MIEVKVLGDDIDRAIRVLKREVQRSGILGKLKERDRGWKPSCRRKLKDAIARRRRQRRERRLRQISLREGFGK